MPPPAGFLKYRAENNIPNPEADLTTQVLSLLTF